MRPAQIALDNYFVSELQFTANQSFNANQPHPIDITDLQVTHDAVSVSENRHKWQVTLRVALNTKSDRNLPYCFLVEMVGFVDVAESVSEENIERFVGINGTSLLFSAAREIVRAVTMRGPFKPIMLPTVSFWEPKHEPTPQVTDETTTEDDPAAAPETTV